MNNKKNYEEIAADLLSQHGRTKAIEIANGAVSAWINISNSVQDTSATKTLTMWKAITVIVKSA